MKYKILTVAIACMIVCSTALSLGADVSPQVVLIAQKTQNCTWHEGMTLAEALTKMGGVSVGTVTLIRNGSAETLSVTKDLNRNLAAWDIIVVGH